MKCPHCYCNYDDAERECPMCGAHAGAAARTASSPKTTPRPQQRTRQPAPARPVRQQPRPFVNSPSSPVRPPAAPARPSAPAPKKHRSAILAVLLLLFFQFLPAILGLITNAFSYVENKLEFRDDGFLFSDDVPFDGYGTPEPSPAAPDSDSKFYDGEEEGVILPSGTYYCESTGLALSIDGRDLTYRLTLGDYEESGDLFWEYNDPQSDDGIYTEEFPPSAYDSYFLGFYWETEEDYAYQVAIAYFPLDGSGDQFYLDNINADVLWLPLDRAVLMRRAADESGS